MNVGKTCLLTKYIEGSPPLNSNPTIGGELKTKIVQLTNGINIKSQIWDTAGQEKYRSITSQ